MCGFVLEGYGVHLVPVGAEGGGVGVAMWGGCTRLGCLLYLLHFTCQMSFFMAHHVGLPVGLRHSTFSPYYDWY